MSLYKQSFCLANRPHIPLIAVAGEDSLVIDFSGSMQVSTCGEHNPGPCPGRPALPPQGPVNAFMLPSHTCGKMPGISNDPPVFLVNQNGDIYLLNKII